ncbi:MAG: lipopolysaccharide heptosyltransferase I [Psittacicella sp.]
MKICIVKVSSMGDVIHTLPGLTDLLENISDLEIDWVVEKSFSEIPLWHKGVNEIKIIELRKWKKEFWKRSSIVSYKEFKNDLNSKKYDYILDIQALFKTSYFIVKNSKAINKVGYDKSSAKESISSLFYNTKIYVDKDLHAIDRIKIFFGKVFHYEPNLNSDNFGIRKYFEKLSHSNVVDSPYIVCLHATSSDKKCWPEEYWKEFILEAIKRGYKIKLPWGSQVEYERALRLKISNEVEVLPRLSLTKIGSIIFSASFVVSVDTGLGHLASALDKKCIHLYGPTYPKLIGSRGLNQIDIKKSSMDEIKPKDIISHLFNI